MSLPEQEARALDAVKDFMLALGNGQKKVTTITALRKEALSLMRHYPLAAGFRWLEFHDES